MGHAAHVRPSRSLTLEWNNLGTWEDAFATFCGALAANGTLRQLDLRNNQISHKGAEELALALKSNTSLQQLGEAPQTAVWLPKTRAEGGRGEQSQAGSCSVGNSPREASGLGLHPQVPSVW